MRVVYATTAIASSSLALDVIVGVVDAWNMCLLVSYLYGLKADLKIARIWPL